MRVTFHGAARTVTGSMHLVEINGHRILLDCGLMQGRRKEAFKRNRNFPFDPKEIDVVVLSHAHIDHSGNLPSLFRKGFDGPVISTSATRDLCAVMLQDSAHIQEKEVKWINKKRKKQGKTLFEPLYASKDAIRAIKHFRTVGYQTRFQICDGVTGLFYDSGHILGSASVILEFSGGTRLGFTGDIGRAGMPILRDPNILPEVDWLISESTYGNRSQPPFEDMPELLCDIVTKTFGRGGKIIIPAFSVGRTQNLVYSFQKLFSEERCLPIPIYVDSPLSLNATEVFKVHPECYDKETLELLEDGETFLGFDKVTYINKVQVSKGLNKSKEPCVIISASGMCEFGRIVHHIRNNIGDPRSTILIVGYQAEHTLGRRLVEGSKKVKIFGEPHQVKAEVRVLNGYSAHADREDLIDYISKSGKNAQGVFLVHGDEEQSFALKEHLREHKLRNIHVPERDQSFDLI